MTAKHNRINKWLVSLATLVAVFALAGPARAGHGGDKADKTGILLVTFGTSVPRAAKAFDRIDALAKKRFPNLEIRWAYTSGIIRKKQAKQGRRIDSPAVALAKMADDGFTRVAVQSLHVIAGQEFDDLARVCQAMQGLPEGLSHIQLGLPLLASPRDYQRAARAVLASLSADRKKGEALVLMGHGTHHPANSAYPALDYVFKKLDRLTFVGTVEGYPDLDMVRADLKAAGVKRAWLVPFMSVAGDHAMNDMAGEEDDSWKSQLTRAGLDCRPVMKGLAENPTVAAIWLDHLAGAVKKCTGAD